MAGIVFHFEDNDKDVWSGRNIDLDAWNYAMNFCGCIDKAIIVNNTNQTLTSFNEAYDIQYVSNMPPLTGHVTQMIVPWEAQNETKTSLWDFDHLTDWYVFGSGAGWGNYFGDSLVYVPQGGVTATHSVFIATAVMLHRYKVLYG
jgi:hypothetical protein